MAQFVSPARIWFGQMSDAKKLWGYHRSGYVWIGLVLLAIFAFLAVQVVWQLGASVTTGWTVQSTAFTALLALMFALYGFCIGCCATPFAALLVDVSDEDNRSQLVGVVWSMLMVGIVVGAVTSKKLLEGLTPETLQTSVDRLFLILPLAVVCCGFIGTVGVEKKYSRYSSRSVLVNREDRITLGRALKILTASRQTGLFFSFLLVMTISLFLQQPILEPYGGEVFGMTVGEGAQLNAFWGLGILLAMSITGFWVVPRLGKQKTTRLGCWLTAGSFGFVIAAGFTGNPIGLEIAVFLFGLASGVITNSAVSLMLDLTAAETAGTFLGAWGLAQAIAQATATLAGGALLDLGRRWLQTPVLAYGLVFAISGVGMVLAVELLNRVNVTEFRTNARQAIATVLESELDG
jgi:BCD family chlorophyll transporter-like MFS transporter